MRKPRLTKVQKHLLQLIKDGNGVATVSDKLYRSIQIMCKRGLLTYCACGLTITISSPDIDPVPHHRLHMAKRDVKALLEQMDWHANKSLLRTDDRAWAESFKARRLDEISRHYSLPISAFYQ